MNTQNKWQMVIGLETHLQLSTKSKLFSASSTKFSLPPNTAISEIDFGLPGVLPSPNKKAFELAARFGFGINGTIEKRQQFERKHYFYPDLPKGYQITQFQSPIVSSGYLDIELDDNRTKRIRVNRAHLEEDAGKSMHINNAAYSAIDLNRSGCPLLEIVTEPDLNSIEETTIYLKKLHSIAVWLGVSDGEMSEGSMRVDANISVKPFDTDKLGERVEIKNLNSFKFIAKAISFEAKRQIQVLSQGGVVHQETRLYDTAKNITVLMRSKEDSQDYRYFPDPDLVPLIFDDQWLSAIKSEMPALPDDVKQTLMTQFKLSAYDANVLTANRHMAEFALQTLALSNNFKITSNWLISDFLALLQEYHISCDQSPVTPEMLAELVNAIVANKVTGKSAKDVLEKMWHEKKSALQIIKEDGLELIEDEDLVISLVNQVIEVHSEQVLEYKAGKERIIGFLVGKVMQLSKGKANPKKVNELLIEKIKTS